MPGLLVLRRGQGGVRFQVTGKTIPAELRVSFNEAGRSEPTYVLAVLGANTAMFADGKVIYDTKAAAVDVTKIDSVHFVIPTNTTAAVAFDLSDCTTTSSIVIRTPANRP